MELSETDPERASLMIRERRLDLRIRHLASRYRSAKKDQKQEALRPQIRELLEEAFDCRHARRELEIRKLEPRIAELKQRQQKAARARKKLIERELEKRLDRRKADKAAPKEK